MTHERRVEELLDELLDAQSSPEEICRSCPELLPEVRERWKQLCHIRAELETLFPTPQESVATPIAPRPKEKALPEIPGYEVESVIGHGGMGVVFRARHVRLNRVVALKMALVGAYAGPPERERFQREAEAVAALRHPNVVQIHDIGDSEGRPYFTMEYVDGGTLTQKLAGKRQPAREAAALLATLARAVCAAHNGGIIHRDLKPSNVFLMADGTPKIGDFGLARRFDVASDITRTGLAAGTPSYMAPEQARGNGSEVGPSADIHALGAILYEMLTGQPPFEGRTAAETIHRLTFEDPVPPSRLNPKIPRDLETICLKCLQKKPHLRFASASALADDLERFVRGEAIEARPIGRSERLLRRIRRNPTGTALIVTALALLIVAVGAGMREWAARAEREAENQKSAARLDYVIRLQQQGRIPEAREMLGRISDTGSSDLRTRTERASAELDLAERLDAIRLSRASRFGTDLAFKRSAEEYETVFREAGFGMPQEDATDVVARRIQESNVSFALIAALDDWATCVTSPARQSWVLEAAQTADHDPTGWRQRARDPAIWTSREALVQVTADAPVASQSVALLLALGEHLTSVGADAIPFLRRVQLAHPSDFWANLHLAEALIEKNDAPEAIRFYQAAVALRPSAAVVYDKLGLALAMLGRMDEADEQFRQALLIDPKSAAAHDNLGVTSSLRERDGQIGQSKLPGHFNRNVAELHTILADSLRDRGKLAEAMDRYRRAIAIQPQYTSAQHGIRIILFKEGKLREAEAAWKKALDAKPADFDAWDGYLELCLYFGHEAEYRRIRSLLLERFGHDGGTHVGERAGRACLLLPAEEKEQQQAETLISHALAAKPAEPYYRFAKGLADYRRGRLEATIAEMEGDASKVLGPSPRLVKAMALYRIGRQAEARKCLGEAIRSYDWKTTPDHRDIWIFHALRREAEALIFPTLAAFLEGKHQPRDNAERLVLLEGCLYLNRHRAAASLYADAFAADPLLAEDLRSGHRLGAARAAALAGNGLGEDAAGLTAADRTRWRAQARRWMQADLAAWGKLLDGGSALDERQRQALSVWRYDSDLAIIRDQVDLEKLPAQERSAFQALWKDLDVLLERVAKAK